ncbi:MAG TPA: hypothetical protein DCX06_01875 [Opitutae bacterium]|nr:hypothetical protein [Opitutae bacterium]
MLAAVCAQSLAASDRAHAPGAAIITSAKGKTWLSDSNTKRAQLNLHEIVDLTEQTIQTEKSSHSFLACSNGLGIGLDAATHVTFELYTQEPFTAERAELKFEPSTSQLMATLHSGAISLASTGLSPRSQARVKTVNGMARIHSANCRIEQSETGTVIITYGGNATFYYPDGKTREFISRHSAIRISPQSAAIGKIAEHLDFNTLEISKKHFAQAAQNAASRVYFNAPLAGNAATPVLIAPIIYFEQETSRPYEYVD